MPTAIVYGPMGCGKTTHRLTIAKALNIPPENIVDGFGEHQGDKIRHGHLHLCICRPDPRDHPSGIIIRSYSSFSLPKLRLGK